MIIKDYYEELNRIVQQAHLNRRQRMKYCLSQWLCERMLKCFRKYLNETNKTALESLTMNYKLAPFQNEVVVPLNEAMMLIIKERNLGNYLVELTEKNVSPNGLSTHSEIFDILMSLPSVRVHDILSHLYPRHYQQLVAALDAGDKIHFVRYIDEHRLDTKPLSNLCSCFLMEHRMPHYKGNLSIEEFTQLGAEVISMARNGEMEADNDIMKLAGALTDPSQLCNLEVASLLKEYTYNYYTQNLIFYFLHRSQLNSVEQRAIETIVKNSRYIHYYNDISEAYQKVIVEYPGLEERILQKEQALRLKSTKPLEEPSTAIIYSYQMPQAPDKIDKKQIFLLADELINEEFIDKEDREKLIYFLQGSGGRYKEPLAICWHDKYHSLKYLLQFRLYTDLPDNTNTTIAENFIFKKAKGYGNYGEQTLRTCTKSKILQEIDNEKKEKLDEIMAKLKL